MLGRLSGGGLVKLRVDMISDRPSVTTTYQLQGDGRLLRVGPRPGRAAPPVAAVAIAGQGRLARPGGPGGGVPAGALARDRRRHPGPRGQRRPG